MKILWILNSPIGEIANILGFPRSQSGTWIDGAMCSLLEADESISLKILTSANIKQTRCMTVGRVEYCCLNAGRCEIGKMPSSKKVQIWINEIRKFQPDLIHIWGSEFSIGAGISKEIKDIPIVYRIQGAINAISKYPNGNLPLSQMSKKLDFVSRMKLYKYQADSRRMKKQAELELQMLRQAAAIISDNEWALMQYQMKIPQIRIFFDRLPIRDVFSKKQWKSESAQPHSLFCLAGRTAYKGLHQVIEAVHLLKDEFEDIILQIPGSIDSRNPKWLFEPTYITYLKKLITEYGLEKNVVFLGALTAEEMADYMCNSSIFVMPSVIENESATLREAMLLGMPVISSFAGDIYETVIHNKNGLLYRYEEYEMLAYFIRQLFLNSKKAEYLGSNAFSYLNTMYEHQNYGEKLIQIYRELLE